jgi:hypothetical protein
VNAVRGSAHSLADIVHILLYALLCEAMHGRASCPQSFSASTDSLVVDLWQNGGGGEKNTCHLWRFEISAGA